MAIINGTTYHDDTPQAVIAYLETARQRKTRIRVFYGDVQTGKSWDDYYDTMGRVGRSTGKSKIPLLIHNARSMGEGAILDHCIIRITIDKQVIYSHPNFHTDATTDIDFLSGKTNRPQPTR